MYENVFVFGSEIFPEIRRDFVASLPLELSWKIFSYLDKVSLWHAIRTCKLWKRIVTANKRLRLRINEQELVMRLGSEGRAEFYKANRKILKRLKRKNYLPVSQSTVQSMEKTIVKSKRGGEDMIIYTKRYKFF